MNTRMVHACLMAAGALALAGCATRRAREKEIAMAAEKCLLILENDRIRVGILPHVGGRIVLLRRPDGENVLHSDPTLWTTPESEAPEPTVDAPFAAYNGHITWVGPQSGWWTQQNLDAVRRERAPGWPPDPWIVLGRFEVEEKTEDRVKMVGPASPVTGLRMMREIELRDDGTVFVRVTAENTRREPVSWDLWSNTRMAGRNRCYVPCTKSRVRVEFKTGNMAADRPMPVDGDDGFFTFDPPRRFEDGVMSYVSKAFIAPKIGLIAGFTSEDVLLKRAELPGPKDVHPEQSPVEIYQALSADGKRDLLELEMHGPFRTLAPGESMTFEETWQVLPYRGPDTPAAHVSFLRKLGVE